MHEVGRDEQPMLAGPESLDFVIYEIDNNGHNGADEPELSSLGEDGYATALDQLPSEYKIVDSDAEPTDDWQECISIAEQSCNTAEAEAILPAPESEVVIETTESPASPEPPAPLDQQDLLPRSNSIPALGPISDLLKTRPTSMQQTPQPLPVLPERRPVTAQPVTAKVPGGKAHKGSRFGHGV